MKLIMTLIAMLFITTGCSLFQGAKPESVNQSFYLAYALVQSGYDSIEIAIRGGQIKTQKQANALKDPLDESKRALDVAKATWSATGELDEAVFDSTRSILIAMQQTLLALGVEDERPVLEPLGVTS